MGECARVRLDVEEEIKQEEVEEVKIVTVEVDDDDNSDTSEFYEVLNLGVNPFQLRRKSCFCCRTLAGFRDSLFKYPNII